MGLICAFEEERNIGAVLAAMPKSVNDLDVSTLVIVDGGSDRTDEVSLEAGAITFVLSENLGHGYALRIGYALCVELGAQYVVTLDADGQNDPAEIPVMLQPLRRRRGRFRPGLPRARAGHHHGPDSARPECGSSRPS